MAEYRVRKKASSLPSQPALPSPHPPFSLALSPGIEALETLSIWSWRRRREGRLSSQEKRGKGLRAFFTHRYAQGGQNNPKIPRKENVHAKLHLRESVHLKRTNFG